METKVDNVINLINALPEVVTLSIEEDILKQDLENLHYNLDLCGYPHEEEVVLSPMETIQNYQEKRASLNAEIDHVLAELEALLPGGDK